MPAQPLGLLELKALFTELLQSQFGEFEKKLEAKLQMQADTPPVTISGAELIEHWKIESTSTANALQILGRRAARAGLKPKAGTRGLKAVYRWADVLRADAVGVGELRNKQAK